MTLSHVLRSKAPACGALAPGFTTIRITKPNRLEQQLAFLDEADKLKYPYAERKGLGQPKRDAARPGGERQYDPNLIALG